MKKLMLALSILLSVSIMYAQNQVGDLRKTLAVTTDDSVLYMTANQLYDNYEELKRDSALIFAEQCVLLCQKNNRKLNEAYSLTRKAYQELNLGRFGESLHNLLEAFSISEDKKYENSFWMIEPLKSVGNKRLYALSCTHHIFAILMRETQNREQELAHFREAKRIAVEINNPARSLLGSLNIGRIYNDNGQLDSAMIFEDEAEEIARNSGRMKYLPTILYLKGAINMKMKDTSKALNYFHESIQAGNEQHNIDGMVLGFHALANYYESRKNMDSSLYYAIKSMETLRKLGAVSVNIDYNIGGAYEDLYLIYRDRTQFDSAYKYLALAQFANDSIYKSRIRSLAQFQQLTLNEQQRIGIIEKERTVYQNKVRIYFLLAGIMVLLLLAIIFYRNNRQKHKAKIKIEQAYDNLKATQQQLIQSEKMASLGELTAGIAHEIQNPLNFINNFSELNVELIEEMKGDLQSGKSDQVLATAQDISDNEQKINHHGRRAESIVKGMLQHSRSSSGKKEPTDINALAEEWLRLSYHGFRTKEKSFNANIQTEFDESIGHINLVPQDIGRVLLNLYNNAFYALAERQKQQSNNYEPILSVTTRAIDNKIKITVADNGNGIPPAIREKIFQPFFTTKPTGQGTGLGLSLAYDIIKAHGGELKVHASWQDTTEFIIELPIK